MQEPRRKLRQAGIVCVGVLIVLFGAFLVHGSDHPTGSGQQGDDPSPVTCSGESQESGNHNVQINNPDPDVPGPGQANLSPEAGKDGEQINGTAVPTSASGGITSAEGIPEFSGVAYTVLNDNVPDFSRDVLTTIPFEIYSELDELGRCGPAFANVCTEIMPDGPRGEIGMIKPSGWYTARYDDVVEGNYLYNRCHLIGYKLSGENANPQNLITGTRYLNTVGMLEFEKKVLSFVRETGYHVLYRSTPVFEGSNLVASGVQLEAMSVEDQGKGLCFNVYLYNVQPGIVIDYATGESYLENPPAQQKDKNYGNIETLPLTDGKPPQADETDKKVTYILNTNSGKFHFPSCQSVADIKEKYKQPFYGTREDAISEGYSPCGKCHP